MVEQQTTCIPWFDTKQTKYTTFMAQLYDGVYHAATVTAPRRVALRGAPTVPAPSLRTTPSSRSVLPYKADALHCVVRSTMLVPSRNRVRKRTFALVKRPSLSETTMNCVPRKRVQKRVLMCCVWDRSSVASILSSMYIGTGLNCSVRSACALPVQLPLFGNHSHAPAHSSHVSHVPHASHPCPQSL